MVAGGAGRLRLDPERLLPRQLELQRQLRRQHRDGPLRRLQRRDHEGPDVRRRRAPVLLPAQQGLSSTTFNTTEIYGSLAYSFFTLKYSHTVSKDYFGLGQINQGNEGLATRPSGRNTGYLDFSGNYEVAKGLTLNGHVGYTRLARDLRDAVNTSDDADDGTITTKAYANYVDWKAGATYDLGSGFSLAGAVVGATKKSVWGDVNKTRFIATISKTM